MGRECEWQKQEGEGTITVVARPPSRKSLLPFFLLDSHGHLLARFPPPDQRQRRRDVARRRRQVRRSDARRRSLGRKSFHRHRSRSSASAAAATTTTGTALADLSKFSLPELRVGTLDALLGLSDDLVRVNAAVEGVTNKLRRQLLELSGSRAAEGAVGTLLGGGNDESSASSSSATVDGVPPESYLERFSWDAAKHPPRRPLGETAAAIAETAAKMEGDLKARAGEVAALRSALAAANRKASGSLAVRDLAPLLARAPRGRLVDTENLATLAVVVPRGAEREWLASYETLTDFVVPRSGGNSGPVAEDGDYVLHTVVLFRRVADAYRAAARAKGFQVRDVDVKALLSSDASTATNGDAAAAAASSAAAAPSAASSSSTNATASVAALRSELEAKRTALERWARAAYGEFFFFFLFFSGRATGNKKPTLSLSPLPKKKKKQARPSPAGSTSAPSASSPSPSSATASLLDFCPSWSGPQTPRQGPNCEGRSTGCLAARGLRNFSRPTQELEELEEAGQEEGTGRCTPTSRSRSRSTREVIVFLVGEFLVGRLIDLLSG